MQERVLVMGASGLVGGMVLRMLLAHGLDAVGASREARGEDWVRLDLLDTSTHGPALAGVGTAMLISRPGDEEAHAHAAPLIDAMVAAGVRRIVDLSALGAEKRPEFSTRRVECLVEASGLEWVHVRPNFFGQMLARPPLSTEIARRRTLTLPLGLAKIAYVDARDVAAVLYRALTDPGLNGRAIAVSGPEAMDHEEVARRIAIGIGEPVRYIDIPEEAARALLAGSGFSPPHIERVLRFYALCRQGFCATPDTEVARLLGRPLGTLDDVIAANRPVWLP